MSGNLRKEDLRIVKTYRALMDALESLLERRNFSQITVNDLCEEAMLSRATFYYHFNDKYDLLKYSMMNSLSPEITNGEFEYEYIEKSINNYVNNNSKVIKNLVENADNEVTGILCDFMLSIIGISVDGDPSSQKHSQYMVFVNFCAGGMVNFLSWQVKNKFPIDLKLMNAYLFEILEILLKWYSDKNKNERQ